MTTRPSTEMRPPGVYAAFTEPAKPPFEMANTRIAGFVGLSQKGPLDEPVGEGLRPGEGGVQAAAGRVVAGLDAGPRARTDLGQHGAAAPQPALGILDHGGEFGGDGLTRRGAIPLLEWLDARGVTRRVGDVRVAGRG